MRDTVDVGKWLSAGYKQGYSAMNTTTHGDSSFLDHRLNRNSRTKENLN